MDTSANLDILPGNFSDDTVREIVATQRRFFRTGTTLPVSWRIKQLKRLKEAVLAHEAEFIQALADDLGRSEVEAYLCDIGPIVVEINEMIRGLRRWARPEIHFSGLICFPSIFTKVYKMPYGVSLIISPFNFPILLTIGVVAAAITPLLSSPVLNPQPARLHSSGSLQKSFLRSMSH